MGAAALSRLPSWYPGPPSPHHDNGDGDIGSWSREEESQWVQPVSWPRGDASVAEDDLPTVELENLQFVANGSFCSVFSARYCGWDVAVKTARLDLSPAERELATQALWQEFGLLRCMHHPHIINVYGMCRLPRESTVGLQLGVFLMEEQLSLGTVAHLTRTIHTTEDSLVIKYSRSRRKRLVPMRRRLQWCLELALALEHIHRDHLRDWAVMHRDLKTVNVGFGRDGRLVLMDFGLATVLDTTKQEGSDDTYKMTGEVGSYRYMAPEVMLGREYNTSADMYSWSLVAWEMLSFRKPFALSREQNFVHNVAIHNLRPLLPSKWPPKVRELLARGWGADPAGRPTATEAARCLTEVLAELYPDRASPLGTPRRFRMTPRAKPKVPVAGPGLVAAAAAEEEEEEEEVEEERVPTSTPLRVGRGASEKISGGAATAASQQWWNWGRGSGLSIRSTLSANSDSQWEHSCKGGLSGRSARSLGTATARGGGGGKGSLSEGSARSVSTSSAPTTAGGRWGSRPRRRRSRSGEASRSISRMQQRRLVVETLSQLVPPGVQDALWGNPSPPEEEQAQAQQQREQEQPWPRRQDLRRHQSEGGRGVPNWVEAVGRAVQRAHSYGPGASNGWQTTPPQLKEGWGAMDRGKEEKDEDEKEEGAGGGGVTLVHVSAELQPTREEEEEEEHEEEKEEEGRAVASEVLPGPKSNLVAARPAPAPGTASLPAGRAPARGQVDPRSRGEAGPDATGQAIKACLSDAATRTRRGQGGLDENGMGSFSRSRAQSLGVSSPGRRARLMVLDGGRGEGEGSSSRRSRSVGDNGRLGARGGRTGTDQIVPPLGIRAAPNNPRQYLRQTPGLYNHPGVPTHMGPGALAPL